MDSQTPLKLIQQKAVLQLFITLEEHAGEEMLAEVKADSYTIWAKDNSFPLDILNKGNPGSKKWEGNHEVIESLKPLIGQGYSIKLVCREDADETNFVGTNHQDYKLVISK